MDKNKLLKYLDNTLDEYEILIFDFLDSTNNESKRRNKPNLIIISLEQSLGRGRFGRSFSSEKGGLYLSFNYSPCCSPENAMHFTALAALAVSFAIESVLNSQSQIKWPNDILLSGKKVCGILTEAIHFGANYHLIVGIGINIFNTLPQELKEAARLSDFSSIDIEKFTAELLLQLKTVFDSAQTNKQLFIEEYRRRCITIGKNVSCTVNNEKIVGKAIDIDSNAALIIQKNNGDIISVVSGEATLH